MIFFIIAYSVVAVYGTLLAAGFQTIDIRLRDISFFGAVTSLAIGIFWLPCLICSIIWITWDYHRW
jgi:hypothetical protein